MQGLADFLSMGGYAAYVWPAFGFTLAVLLGLLAQSWWAARRRDAEFARLRHAARGAVPSRPAAPRRAVRATGGEPPRVGTAEAAAPRPVRE